MYFIGFFYFAAEDNQLKHEILTIEDLIRKCEDKDNGECFFVFNEIYFLLGVYTIVIISYKMQGNRKN